MKRIIFIIVLVLVAGSWGGNLWYYHRSQLPEPVFLNHFIEVENSPGYSFDLLYLENKSAKTKLQWIEIPELPNVQISPIPDVNSYAHQTQGTMRVQIMDYDLVQPEFPEKGPLVIHRVLAHFDDNSSKEMEIGEIQVFRPDPKLGAAPVQGTSSGSSSYKAGFARVKFKKDARLTGINSTYLPSLADRFNVILDTKSIRHLEQKEISYSSEGINSGVPLEKIPFPLKFKSGETATVTYQLALPDGVGPIARTDVYRFLLHMELETDQGERSKEVIFVDIAPYLTGREVADFVQARRSGE